MAVITRDFGLIHISDSKVWNGVWNKLMHTPHPLAVWLGASLLLTPMVAFANEVTATTSTSETASPETTSTSTSATSVPIQATIDSYADLVPTSTAPLTLPEIIPVIDTSTVIIPENSTSTTAISFTSSTPIVATPSPPLLETNSQATSTLCLGIISPAPTQGYEWVAFRGLTPSTTNALIGWSLFDAQGSLLKFATSTTLLWDESTQTMRVELRSSRLNNDGDSVILKNPTTEIFDQFIYTKTDHDQRWMRDTCASSWYKFPLPTPPPTPIPIPVAVPAESSAPVAVQTLPTSTTSTVAVIEPTPVMTIENAPLPELPIPVESVTDSATSSESDTPVTSIESDALTVTFIKPPTSTTAQIFVNEAEVAPHVSVMPAKDTPITTVSKTSKSLPKLKDTQTTTDTATKTKTNTKTKAPVIKKTPTKAPKKTSATSLISLDMNEILNHPETRQGIRVRLSGRVASAPSIVGAQKYVIVNEDGRGLLVAATTKQPTPPIGTRIDITGTIVWNDAGVSLKQSTTDRWSSNTALPPTTTNPEALIPTRIVDLVAPGQEDAWSFIHVEGRVSAVQNASFEMDVGDASIRVLVRSRLGYRVKRLKVGDTVSVRGLLDMRTDSPAILPQSAEAIQVLTRAPLVNPDTQSPVPVSQPWLPVGAAAGTFAVSEGWRRIHAWRKQRQEKAAFQALMQKTGKEIA